MVYRKYTFSSEESCLNLLGQFVALSVFFLGYQEDTTFAVDVIWPDSPPAEFQAHEVWPDGVGLHIFDGHEAAYISARTAHLNA